MVMQVVAIALAKKM